MPVVCTPTMNLPSKRPARACDRSQLNGFGNMGDILTRRGRRASRFSRWMSWRRRCASIRIASDASLGPQPRTQVLPTEPRVIEVTGLCKMYDEFAAVRDLSFTVHPGEVLGLVGP